MILANKMDKEMEIEVTDEEIQQLEEHYPQVIKVVKTSAKLGTNVDDSFVALTKIIVSGEIQKINNGTNDS